MRQYWVSKGWIYFQIDNRGSYNRGKAFEDQIYRAMGSVEVEDQAAAAPLARKRSPLSIPEKIAISGWSYGGYMTLKDAREGTQGPLYAAGVAGAPVTRVGSLYDTHYTERYLGRSWPSIPSLTIHPMRFSMQ